MELLYVISVVALVYAAVITLNGFFLLANILLAILFTVMVGLFFKARSIFDIDSPKRLHHKLDYR